MLLDLGYQFSFLFEWKLVTPAPFFFLLIILSRLFFHNAFCTFHLHQIRNSTLTIGYCICEARVFCWKNIIARVFLLCACVDDVAAM